MAMSRPGEEVFAGCLLGTAVGDSIGLPTEGLSRRRLSRLYPGELKHRLVFGMGMMSDDTEHTVMVAGSLLRHSSEPGSFAVELGRSLRWWFAAIPAGVGLGTARAICRLWRGIPASRSGVGSAGNGPAMRSSIIGVYFLDDPAKRESFARASCLVTHHDPRALEAALLVAEAAAFAAKRVPSEEVLDSLEGMIHSREMEERFASLKVHLGDAAELTAYAEAIGSGKQVSGFAPDSVSVALYGWLRYRGDFRRIISEVVACGGDTDTVAAIAGGIAGAECLEQGIPADWIEGIRDYPNSTEHLRRVAGSLAAGRERPPSSRQCLWLVRNLFFLLIVLFHGLRRLFPPY